MFERSVTRRASDRDKRCNSDNEWTFGDGFQTLCNDDCRRATSMHWLASTKAARPSTYLRADTECIERQSSTTSTRPGSRDGRWSAR